MHLGVRHGTGFKPAVQHFGGAVISFAVFFDNDLVDEVFVQIGDFHSGEFLQFSDTADADTVFRIFVIDPDGDAGTPEAVAADIPVTGIEQPVAEAFATDVIGLPADRFVGREKFFVEILYFDVPCFDGPVDERGIGTVAERIAVGDGRLMDEFALIFEAADDILVAIFTESSGVFGDLIGEVTGSIQRIGDGHDPGFPADPEVIFAVCRGDVDQADTVIDTDVIIVEYPEGTFRSKFSEVGEERFVSPVFQLAAFHFGDDLKVLLLAEERGDTGFGHDITCFCRIGEIPDNAVIDICSGTDGKVFWQCPRGGRPDEQISFAPCGIGTGSDLCPDGDRRILHIFVVAAGFEV